MTVVLYPDYVVYRDSYCTEPRLTFSDSCIKVSGSKTSGPFDFEWGVDDLITFECQRFPKAEFVMIKLRVISKDAPQEDIADGVSGFEELKIAVVEPYWSEKEERIASLNAKYLNAWVLLQDMGVETDEDDSPGQGHHFPNFDEPFEDVVYPKGEADAVSISKRDVDLLQPETFITDTIIDFYIKYLKNQIQPKEKHRFHFFNSFFFRKLADLDKDPSSVSDGRAAFQRVRKWTRKVDLFEKDYIFIPVNFNLHWSLIVICHPGEVPRLNGSDGESGKSLKVPCILHMDSIKGSHTGLKNLIQSYLWEEWKERKKEASEEMSAKFHNCGLSHLSYRNRKIHSIVACFCSTIWSCFWSSECVSDEGLVLREFFEPGATPGSLFGQYQSFDQKSSFYLLNGAIPPIEEDTENGEHFAFSPTGDSGFQQITGITSQTCGIPYTSRAYGAETSYDLGISAQEENGNIDSSPKPSNCASDHSEDLGVMENHSVGEEDLGLSQKEEMDVNNPAMENVTCLTDGLVSAPGNPDASIIEGSQDHDKVHYNNGYGGSQDPEKVHEGNGNGSSPDHDKVHDGNGNGGSRDPDKEHDGNENGGSRDPDEVHNGTENEGSQDCDKLHDGNENEGSWDRVKVHDGNENGAPLSSCQENPDIPAYQDSNMVDNRTVSCDDAQMFDDDRMPEPQEQPAAKRLRLTPPLEGEKCVT
ncbi:hypothetical protein Pyn_37763 [Prunus yedoensis var. nudiflora]|uniref:Ubiquitin-like protease family profile domain-containing protein n=1 Tax=Prunus yedoensis var. nudiflora TaxID=2094558 RepID=A0A314Z7J8_PRUYE|nr:hypothetical protein Pyn_37763 [Prunus yedoensis var. nudiflora]